MPPNRLKILHPTGTVTKIKFVSRSNHNYTGVFRGADYGILRISEVADVDPEAGVSSPSAGLKFLRDGIDSANLFTLHAFEGQPSYNFLRNSLFSHVDQPTNECNLMTSHAKLSQVSKHFGNMSVKSLSDFDQYGNLEEHPVWPFKVELRPWLDYDMPDYYVASYLDQLTHYVKEGTKLYKVIATDEPEALGGSEKHIGDIVTTSPTVTSLWGDTRLFFRHTRFDEDIAARPEWESHVEKFTGPTFAENLPLPAEAPADCPFAFLFGVM